MCKHFLLYWNPGPLQGRSHYLQPSSLVSSLYPSLTPSCPRSFFSLPLQPPPLFLPPAPPLNHPPTSPFLQQSSYFPLLLLSSATTFLCCYFPLTGQFIPTSPYHIPIFHHSPLLLPLQQPLHLPIFSLLPTHPFRAFPNLPLPFFLSAHVQYSLHLLSLPPPLLPPPPQIECRIAGPCCRLKSGLGSRILIFSVRISAIRRENVASEKNRHTSLSLSLLRTVEKKPNL